MSGGEDRDGVRLRVIMSGFAALAMWFLLSRPRGPLYPVRRDRAWHRCWSADCRPSKVLLRPRELMCGAHWQRVGVPLRLALERASDREWPALARRAINFVDEQLARQTRFADIEFGENALDEAALAFAREWDDKL